MKSNRRLVIPQVGLLLKKEEGGQLLFSPLMSRDDGILRSLLLDRGVSEIEASGIIDRVVFDFRFAMDNHQSYTLEGIGIFNCDANGAVLFTEQLKERKIIAPQPQEELPIATQEPIKVIVEPLPTPLAAPKTSPKEVAESKPQSPPKSEHRPHISAQRTTHSNKKVDYWIVIGVAAALLAGAALLYGFLREGADIASQLGF